MPKIWLDVEDMFDYAGVMSRPSGIQRLSFELYAALVAIAGDRIGFFRVDRRRKLPVVIPWEQLRDTYLRLVNAPPEPKSATPPRLAMPADAPKVDATGRTIPRSLLGRLASRLPVGLRTPLLHALEAQGLVFKHLAFFLSNLWKGVKLRLPGLKDGSPQADQPNATNPFDHWPKLTDQAKPGDFILALGARWSDPDYADLVRELGEGSGLRFGVMIYDLIPLTRPEFCEVTLRVALERFLRTVLPLSDVTFAISHATARDVDHWAAKADMALRTPIRVLPIGTGFTPPPVSALPDDLTDGSYVLFVSTIEARKNHVLAFRAWRRLIDELPLEQVPTLVFAGRIGWIIEDLIEWLRNSQFLNGKIKVVSDADDRTLAALYRGARFTIFPSHYEGWGLPVTESLGYGKVCIGSTSTSVPEAGGPFCLYHDPDNVTEAFNLYRKVITEPEIIEGLERKIAADYRPKTWSECATALLAAVDETAAQGSAMKVIA